MRFLLIMLLFLQCKSGNKRIVNLSEIGWSFELPSDLRFNDSAFNHNGQINKSSWDTSQYDDRSRVELFWIKPEPNNYFNAIVYIDSSDSKKWETNVIADSRFYIGFVTQTPQLKLLDSLISIENIDGINFQKEYIKIYNTAKRDTTHSYKFSRKYKNYSININIRYKNKDLGNKLMGILYTSKFDK